MAAPTRVVIDDSITIDCSISERHTSVVELTRHPIEEGANPVDHAREQPERVQMDGLLTNTPLGPEEQRSLLKKFTDWTGATTAGSGVAP